MQESVLEDILTQKDVSENIMTHWDVPEEISTPEGVSEYVNIRRYPGNNLNPGAGDILDDPRTFPTGES